MMQSNGYNGLPAEPRTGHSLRRVFAAAAVLLLLAVLLLILSIVQSRHSPVSLRQNGFLPSDGKATFYAAAGNGLAAADSDEIRLFSSAGKAVARCEVQLHDPVCAAGAAVSVYYDGESPSIYALYPDGVCRTASTEGLPVFVDVNETGLITVILDKSDSLGSVMVYDTDLTPLFLWSSGTSYPVSARISGNDILCVGCVSREGGALRFFRIDSSEEQGRFDLPGEVIVDIGYVGSDTLAAVTPESVLFVSPAGQLLQEHSFQGDHLDAYSLTGAFAAVSTVSGFSGGTGTITTFDGQGQVIASLSAPRHVEALSVGGEELLALFTGEESTLFSAKLEELVSYQPEEGVTQVFLTPGGMAYFAGPEGVTQIDFSR